MSMKKITIFKFILTATYVLLVMFVPNLPSYYTFIVTSLAYIITLLVFFIFIHFLNSKPKRLLNRLLVLFLTTGILATTRCYFMCFATSLFHSSLDNFVNSYRTFSIIILPLNSYSIFVAGGFLWLSLGRLLLFVHPSFYQRVNPSSCSQFAGISILLIGVLDSLYNWVKCGNYEDHTNIRLLKLLRGELGLLQDANPCNKTTFRQENEKECTFFPTIQILTITSLVLEIIKVFVSTLKDVKNGKRQSKVFPLKPLTEIKVKRVLPARQIQRSETFPKFSQVKFKNVERRHSISGSRTIPLINLTDTTVTPQLQHQTKVQTKFPVMKIIVKSIRNNCLRSSSILTIVVLVCAISATVNANSDQKSTCWVYPDSLNTANKNIRMLVYFCIPLCIFCYDNELFSYFLQKFIMN